MAPWIKVVEDAKALGFEAATEALGVDVVEVKSV
jgi:hypothetical protein